MEHRMHNFKNNTKVYLVRGGLRYELEVYPDISFSQTFSETAIPRKTLHSMESFFDNAVTTQANPANFSFTTPIHTTTHFRVLYDLLVGFEYRGLTPALLQFDLYFVSDTESYKLEGAVIESGVIQFDMQSILIMSISGTASKLSLITGSGIPGTLQPKPSTPSYGIIRAFEATIAGTVLDAVTAATIELRNNNLWLGIDSIHSIASSFETTAYPTQNLLQSRVLSGTIEHNVYAGQAINSWQLGSSVNIKAGPSSATYLVEALIPATTITTRAAPGDQTLRRGIDFRALETSVSLSNILKLNQT